MNILVKLLGLSVKILTYKSGDTIVFQTTQEGRYEDLEWISATLKKYLKTNVIVLQGVELKGVLKKEKDDTLQS